MMTTILTAALLSSSPTGPQSDDPEYNELEELLDNDEEHTSDSIWDDDVLDTDADDLDDDERREDSTYQDEDEDDDEG